MLNNIERQELIKLLSDLVSIPSINPTGEEKEVTNYLCDLFQKEGISYRLIDVTEERKVIVAKIEGENHDNAIIFTGHQDVVPISDDEMKRWQTYPFEPVIKDGKLYGRGSSDMKGGVSAAVYAALMLKRNNLTPNHDILLVLTCDEEHYMLGSRQAILDDEIKRAKYCIVCEPTEMKICYASKGRTWAEVIVHGKTAHGSQRGIGINAIEKCSDLIQDIKKYDFSYTKNELTGETFWQPYAINAGVEPAIVPDRCSMFVDARLTLGHSCDDVWNSLKKLIDERNSNNDSIKAEIRVVENREPWITDKDDYIIALTKKILGKYQTDIQYDVFKGTTDGTKFKSIGITPIIFGPGDLSCVHKENESIDLAELERATEVYYEIMKTYSYK